MLSEISGTENYKFNPKMFITDEAGANFNGILSVFGQLGLNKAFTCQFHFKQSLEKMLTKFQPELNELKGEFEILMMQLLTVPTLSEYQEMKNRITVIASLVPAIQGQVDWWLARRYNIFPVFRGFCLTFSAGVVTFRYINYIKLSTINIVGDLIHYIR